MNKSSIEWTDYTSNPIQAYADVDARGNALTEPRRGWWCEKVSPGCANCYASTQNRQQLRGGTGFPFLPAYREHHRFVLNENELREWAKPKYARSRCFAFDMTDLFGEWVPDEWLAEVVSAMSAGIDGRLPENYLTFQILTKRPERMRAFMTNSALHRTATHDFSALMPLPNVWLGVTVENQRWADERIPILLDTPAAVRFVSAEPLLGPVWLAEHKSWSSKSFDEKGWDLTDLDQIIVGGESGPRHHVDAWDRTPRMRPYCRRNALPDPHKIATIVLTCDPYDESTSKAPKSDWDDEGFSYLTRAGLTVFGLLPAELWRSWHEHPQHLYVVRFEVVEYLEGPLT